MSQYNQLIDEINKRYQFKLVQTKENEFEYPFTVSDPNLRFLFKEIKVIARCYEHQGVMIADLQYDYLHPYGHNGYSFGYMKQLTDGSFDFRLHNE